MSLQNKLIIPVLAMLLIVSMIVGTVGYVNQQNLLLDQMKQQSKSNLSEMKEAINNNTQTLTVMRDVMKSDYLKLAGSIAHQLDENPAMLKTALLHQLAEKSGVMEISVTDKSGVYIYSNVEALIGQDIKASEDTKALMDMGKEGMAMDPVERSLDQRLVMNIGVKRQDDQGIVQIVIDMNDFTYVDLMRQMDVSSVIYNRTLGETGYLLIVKGENVVATSNIALFGKSIKDIPVLSVIDDDIGSWVSDDNGENAYVEIQKGGEYKLISVAHEADYLAPLANYFWLMIIIEVVCSAAAVAIIWLLLRKAVFVPLTRLKQAMHKVSLGELDNNQDLNKASKDIIGDVIRSFSDLKMSLRQMVVTMQQTGEQVADSSEKLSAFMKRTEHTAVTISKSIADVSEGAVTQKAGAQETAVAMEEMSLGIQRLTDSFSNVSEASFKMKDAAAQGNALIVQTVTQMESITTTVNDSSSRIKSLEESSNRVHQIVEAITSIAQQTNMLALNASIEAARAGEAGRGFAVVAGEVKKLADQSKQSAEQIAAIIRQIQAEVSETVMSIETGTTEVSVGMQIITEAGEAFKHIAGAVEDVSDQIQEVTAATEEMSAGTEQITASVAEMAQIAKDSESKTREVSGVYENQMAEIQDIVIKVEELSSFAKELQTMLSKFRL